MKHRGDRTSDEDVARVMEALRVDDSVPADAALRERLKDGFVSGRIAERGRSHFTAPRRIIGLFSPPLLRPAFVVVALIIAVIAIACLNSGPAWRVTRAGGDGSVQIDGGLIPITRVDLLRREIRSGSEVVVPSGGEVEITSPRMMTIGLTPGTSLTVPPPPARWFDRLVELYARAGMLRISTHERFKGAHLTVRTPDAVVEVTGTTLGVILEPTGTCVCVLEGTVRAEGRAQKMLIPSGKRCYFFHDERPPKMDEILPSERADLIRFRGPRPR